MSMEELELPNFCKRFIYISCVWALVFHVYLSTMSRPGAAEVRRRSQILWNLFLLRTQVQLPALPWHPKTHSNFRNRKSHTFDPCGLLYKCGAYKLIQSHANKIVNLNLKNYQEKSSKAKLIAAWKASTFVQIALHLRRHNKIKIKDFKKEASMWYALFQLCFSFIWYVLFYSSYHSIS